MEAYPEATGTSDEAQLRLLGTQLHGVAPAVPAFASTRERRFFAPTGHTLAPPFLAYWEMHGAQAIFGLPIDEPISDGRGGSLQWFERARLEIASDGHIVRGLVGRESRAEPTPASPPAHVPASMPDLYGLGETEARERLVAMGIREIIVDYQERVELGDLFDQVAPYTVVSHHPMAGAPVSTSDVVILGVRAP
jgi:hypothetical protein